MAKKTESTKMEWNALGSTQFPGGCITAFEAAPQSQEMHPPGLWPNY